MNAAKRGFFALLLILAPLCFSSLVLGLGMASDFLPSDVMEIGENTQRLYSIRIQNPDPVPILVSVTYSDSFLTPLNPQEEYRIEAQSALPLSFNVSVPEVLQNESHTASITVRQVGSEGEGLPILLSVGKTFTIKIVNKEKPPLWPYLVVSLIAVGIAVLFLWMQRSMKGSSERPSQKSHSSLQIHSPKTAKSKGKGT